MGDEDIRVAPRPPGDWTGTRVGLREQSLSHPTAPTGGAHQLLDRADRHGLTCAHRRESGWLPAGRPFPHGLTGARSTKTRGMGTTRVLRSTARAGAGVLWLDLGTGFGRTRRAALRGGAHPPFRRRPGGHRVDDLPPSCRTGRAPVSAVLLQRLGSRARVRWVDLATRPIRTPCGSAASDRPRRPSPSTAPVPCGAHASSRYRGRSATPW